MKICVSITSDGARFGSWLLELALTAMSLSMSRHGLFPFLYGIIISRKEIALLVEISRAKNFVDSKFLLRVLEIASDLLVLSTIQHVEHLKLT